MCDSSLPVDLNTARELIRLSELYIDGTVKLSTALDQRAMQMAAMSATASSALLLFGLNQPAPLSLYFILPAFAAAAMFFFCGDRRSRRRPSTRFQYCREQSF